MIITAYLCAAAAMCDPTPTNIYVIDGDTIVINQERIRVEGIDAPEVKGKCAEEKRLAALATRRLAEIVDGSELRLERHGRDRYGRTLARLTSDGHDVGELVLRDGLARRWTKKFDYREEPWCQGRPQIHGQIGGREVIGLLLKLAN